MGIRVNVRNEPIITLVHKHEQSSINVKHKSKGREMQTQDNTKMCYQRENRKTRWKNLSTTLQVEIDPLENKVEVHE